MGPSQICGCPFREPRVFTIAHIYIYTYIHIYIYTYTYLYACIFIVRTFIQFHWHTCFFHRGIAGHLQYCHYVWPLFVEKMGGGIAQIHAFFSAHLEKWSISISHIVFFTCSYFGNVSVFYLSLVQFLFVSVFASHYEGFWPAYWLDVFFSNVWCIFWGSCWTTTDTGNFGDICALLHRCIIYI